MRKPRIIIADEDISYIMPLQLKFIEEMFDKIELEVITERSYFNSLFSVPQKADILVVSEGMYQETVQKHDIRNIFLMTETAEDHLNLGRNITGVYKYTSIKEIFSIITGKISGVMQAEKEESKIILVTSASGGVGKTTVAMGMAACLAKKYKRVLYLNSDYLQNFQWLLVNQAPITDNELYMRLAQGEKNIYQNIRHLIRNEIFDYLPPFKSALLSLGLNHSIIAEIAQQAKMSREYDFIIVDADSSFDIDKTAIIGMADKTVVLTTQSDVSVEATNQLVGNIEVSDKDRLLFVCNMFDANQRNALIDPENNLNFLVNEYVEKFCDYWTMKNEKFMNSPGIQSISISVL